jgi:hypothetical protein
MNPQRGVQRPKGKEERAGKSDVAKGNYLSTDVKEKIMNTRILAAALATAALSPIAAQAQSAAPASAAPAGAAPTTQQAAVAPTVGAKVYGPDGVEAGTVEKVDAANAVVNTGTKRATLPLAAFGKNEKGLLISMSKAQLEAAVAAAETKTATTTSSALVANAPVKTSDGVAIGTVQKVEGDNVTLSLSDGKAITVTKQYLTTGADGSLALTMKSADFKAAVAAASQGAAAGAPASADAKANTNSENAAAPEAPSGD